MVPQRHSVSTNFWRMERYSMKTQQCRNERSAGEARGILGRVPSKSFVALPEKLQDQWVRSLSAVSKMKAEDVSLPQTAREFGLSPGTLRRLGAPALRKDKNGQYVAKASDRLLRPMLVLTREGPREIATEIRAQPRWSRNTGMQPIASGNGRHVSAPQVPWQEFHRCQRQQGPADDGPGGTEPPRQCWQFEL